MTPTQGQINPLAQQLHASDRRVTEVTSILWFRRDLRVGDNPALLAAADAGSDGVVPLFVLDPALLDHAGS